MAADLQAVRVLTPMICVVGHPGREPENLALNSMEKRQARISDRVTLPEATPLCTVPRPPHNRCVHGLSRGTNPSESCGGSHVLLDVARLKGRKAGSKQAFFLVFPWRVRIGHANV